MTTASSIIAAAYREANIVPLAGSPNSNEQTEGLNRLNPIILSVMGQEVGEELCDYNIGGTFDDSAAFSEYAPANARMVLQLTSAKTIRLDPLPYEGQRLAVADASANLAAHNLTLDGYGRTIEGGSTLTLSTNGMSRQWLYRADTANWVKLTDLIASDSMPFPEEFDDYFITRLSLRLNPRNSVQTPQETIATLQRAEQQIQARYRRPRGQQDLGSLGLLGSRSRAYGPSNSEFNSGRPRF